MKKQLKFLLLSLFLMGSLPASASLEMLMGAGDSGPAEDEMNFITYFEKAPANTNFSAEKIILSRDDANRSLRLEFKLAKNNDKKAKKPKEWSKSQWLSSEQQKELTPYLPSLAETVDADSLFTAFLTQLISDKIGKKAVQARDQRLKASFINASSKAVKSLSDLVESDGEFDRSISSYERPQVTKAFVLDTIYRGEIQESEAQEALFNTIKRNDINYEQFYLGDGGFIHISIDSYKTPEEILKNEILLKHAQRVPVNGVDVLGEFQTWFEAVCNSRYKKEVYDQLPGNGMYH